MPPISLETEVVFENAENQSDFARSLIGFAYRSVAEANRPPMNASAMPRGPCQYRRLDVSTRRQLEYLIGVADTRHFRAPHNI